MIAREGVIPIGAACIAAAAVAQFATAPWSLPLWLLAGVLAYLFSESSPAVPNLPLAVLSPANGRVIEMSEARDLWLDRDACRALVELDRFGMGVLRSPVEGKVMDFWTSAQPFNRADTLDATGFSPNCYSTWVQTDEGDDIVLAVSSLRPISRLKLYVAPGERIGIGKRIGFVYFGSVVEVFMPAQTRREAAAGAPAKAGCTVLGSLVRVTSAK
jgi:phosphatidylserine decarboxylase